MTKQVPGLHQASDVSFGSFADVVPSDANVGFMKAIRRATSIS